VALQKITPEHLFSSLTLFTSIIPSSQLIFSGIKNQPPPSHEKGAAVCASCGNFRVYTKNCGDRTCIYCRAKSIKRTVGRKPGLMKKLRDIRFMTLTVKSRAEFSAEEIKEIRKYFQKLIRRKLWKKYVTGGLYVMEVTHTRAGYHYHYHILYEGKFFPWAELMVEWKKVTQGSYIVYIERPKEIKNTTNYVLDYVTKVEKSNIPKHEFAEVMKGIKLVNFFGCWTKGKSIKLSQECAICHKNNWLSPFDVERYCHDIIEHINRKEEQNST